jgi:AbiV family abortive infection protein
MLDTTIVNVVVLPGPKGAAKTRTRIGVGRNGTVTMAKRLPDEREAVEGARTASATAAGLLKDADILAGAGSYGTATSLAVLGFEESVKARTLGAIAAAASMGRRPGFSEDGLRKIIYSGHRERHTAAFVQHLAAALPDDYGKLMLGMPLSAEGTAMLRELTGLASTANAGKQAGFYSDFDPDSGTWSSPGSLTEADYAKVRVLIGDYISETQRQFNEFTHDQPAPGSRPPVQMPA